MWRVFKLLLSGLLVAAAFAVSIGARDPSGWGVAGVLLFMAAAPWVVHERPSRSLALAVVVFALGLCAVGVSTFTGTRQFPQDCSGRRRFFCELENLLYLAAGRPATAMPWFLLAAFALLVAWRLYLRARAA